MYPHVETLATVVLRHGTVFLKSEILLNNISIFSPHLKENAAFIVKISLLILFSEIIVLYCKNYRKHISTLYLYSPQFANVKVVIVTRIRVWRPRNHGSIRTGSKRFIHNAWPPEQVWGTHPGSSSIGTGWGDTLHLDKAAGALSW
jgi:hypothetical protein